MRLAALRESLVGRLLLPQKRTLKPEGLRWRVLMWINATHRNGVNISEQTLPRLQTAGRHKRPAFFMLARVRTVICPAQPAAGRVISRPGLSWHSRCLL